MVSWKQHVSAIVLVLLTGLPVSGTVCALVCQPPAGAAAHHGSGAGCAERASVDPGMRGVAAHDCLGHVLGAEQLATTSWARASGSALPDAWSIAAALTRIAPTAARSPLEYGTPRGTPPATSPLVLRV
jgi:hypothetical protein